MILYFSATGNSKYVAERIAQATGEDICSIEQVQEVNLKDDELFGLVCPTYFGELPILSRTFLTNTHIHQANNNYFFLVTTYGRMTGCVGEDARRVMCQRGIPLHAAFGVQMPDTFTPIYDVSDKEEMSRQVERAEPQIDRIIEQIKARTQGNYTQHKAPYFVRWVTDLLFQHNSQTRFFAVDEEACVGCGLWAKKCPMQAISMVDRQSGDGHQPQKTPQWTKERCAICLGCLHRCPKFAIRYGKNTPKHGQYTHPKTKM